MLDSARRSQLGSFGDTAERRSLFYYPNGACQRTCLGGGASAASDYIVMASAASDSAEAITIYAITTETDSVLRPLSTCRRLRER